MVIVIMLFLWMIIRALRGFMLCTKSHNFMAFFSNFKPKWKINSHTNLNVNSLIVETSLPPNPSRHIS